MHILFQPHLEAEQLHERSAAHGLVDHGPDGVVRHLVPHVLHAPPQRPHVPLRAGQGSGPRDRPPCDVRVAQLGEEPVCGRNRTARARRR
eukprot:1429981-Heterocapsa_arctica.AAC.1